MNTLLVDPPAAPRSEQPTATDRDGGHSGGSGPADGHPPAPPGPQGRTCANCDAPIQDGQQWCLHCGAAQPGSLAARQNWRPLTALALAAVLLVGAAAAAGAAALSSNTTSKPPVPVASAPTPTASTPTTSVPTTPTVPATPGATGTPTAPAAKVPPVGTGTGSGAGSGNSLFPSAGKPPKIPPAAPTPKSSGTETGAGSATGVGTGSGEETSTTTGSKTQSGKSEKQAEEAPSPLLLDTDAASTYNPYNYPAAGFGDPALAIDGEPTTAWTAQVQPSSAPNMAEGLLLDLKSPTKVGAVVLATQTKGVTVQFYGTTDKQAPATITEHGWKQISATRVLKKKTTHVKLRGPQALRYLLVWVVKAPESAVGTPQAPGHVDLNEVELFPPSS